MNQRRSTFLFTVTAFVIAFLYVPMVLLVIYSFNKSRIVPIWGGWSTKWYTELFNSPEVWEAVMLSLKIATVNACFATVLGTLAGLALVRFGRFKGRTLFSGMISAPLVMPEVITGLSLLLLFIWMQNTFGWPSERGFTTITIAHITFSMRARSNSPASVEIDFVKLLSGRGIPGRFDQRTIEVVAYKMLSDPGPFAMRRERGLSGTSCPGVSRRSTVSIVRRWLS